VPLDGTPPAKAPIFNLPPMTKALLAVNCAVFLVEWLLPDRALDSLLDTFGFVPVRYLGWTESWWPALLAPISFQFLHEGASHLFANMLGLVAFGAGVEPRMGRWRFLVFYLLCGVAGAAAQFAATPHAIAALIGASAGVSGLFGAILRFGAFRRRFWLLVGLWLVMNLVTGTAGTLAVGPVAWIAHVGGFVCGLLLYPLFVHEDFAGK